MVIPKVSVIVTIYNREKYIEECARTLFEQTLDDIEYLFIDDASTDRSVIILKNLLDKYPMRQPMTKIICLEQNSGRAVARQTGIDSASGEYVIHVDSDDWVDLDMFEKLYCKAKETNADIVGCNITHEHADCQQVFKQKYSNDMDENIRRLLNGMIFPSLCTSLTRTSLIKDHQISFPRGVDTGEDLLFNLNLYLYGNMVVGIDNPSYHYRHTEDSGSFQHTEKSINSVIEVAHRIESLMIETRNYEKFKDEILFRKFSMKCALITNFENKDYNKVWLHLFPETHKFIWSYKQFSWKRRMELWLASRNLFKLAVLFQKLLRWQHRFRNVFSINKVFASFMIVFLML